MRARLQHAPELLDEETHDPAVLEHSLGHVAQVNRFLGGYSTALAGLRPLLNAGSAARILDIGTATGDIPRAIAAAARAAGAHITIVATDLHPQMRALAQRLSAAWPEITVEAADALALPYPDKSFDAALLSLTLHHFEDDAPVVAVREAGRVAKLVIVNELERGWMNYAGARMLGATWWRSNILTRHDGPLSVLRAFTPDELHDIARTAGLVDVRVQRRWFGRLLMTGRSA
jgi:SAM-dependent methyltransferase